MYGITIRNIFDTLSVSRQRRQGAQEGHNLSAVCRRELGLELDKSYQASDWTIRPLSQAQIDYAALDVEVLIDLHGVFTGNGFLNERKMHV